MGKSINYWILYDDNDNPVSNFDIVVLSIDRVTYSSGVEIVLHLKIVFGSEDFTEVDLLNDDLKKTDWSRLDFRCVVNSQNSNAGKFLVDYIRSKLGECHICDKKGLEKLGISKVDETAVFLAGNRLIMPIDKHELAEKISFRQSSFRLDIDKEMSLEEAFNGMKQLINLSPEIGRIVVAHVISGFIRSAFKEIRFVPSAVLVVLGESGMLKTSYVSHLTQLYNRNDEIRPSTRFNSTARFIEDILHEYSECTAVIDDIHTGGSNSAKKTNEYTAEEIIRRIGDDIGRGYKQGKDSVQKSFDGNVIFTGEYMNVKGSSIPRSLIVEITQKIDGRILDKYQRSHPLLVSTFYYYFLQWYANYYDVICKVLNERFTHQRSFDNKSGVHLRLCEINFYLSYSYGILLEFCRSSNLISDEEFKVEIESFDKQVNRLVFEQQERYNPQPVNYLAIIGNAYRKGLFPVAKNIDVFNENIHVAVLHYRCLCISSRYFDVILSKIIPNYDHDEVIRFLKAKNALKIHKSDGKNNVKISKLGKRFFSIYLDKLS